MAVAAKKQTEELTPTPRRVTAAEGSFKLLEHGRNSYHVLAPSDHTLEEVQDLRYLWHHHARLKPGDTVEICHALFAYQVTILVRDIDHETKAITGYYTVRDLSKEKVRLPDLSAAELSFIDGPHKWAVMLGNELLRSGFDTKSEAEAYLNKKQSVGA